VLCLALKLHRLCNLSNTIGIKQDNTASLCAKAISITRRQTTFHKQVYLLVKSAFDNHTGPVPRVMQSVTKILICNRLQKIFVIFTKKIKR
jgi:hypothetical protein